MTRRQRVLPALRPELAHCLLDREPETALVRSVRPAERGVGILNPVQPECMVPARTKREYGKDLALPVDGRPWARHPST